MKLYRLIRDDYAFDQYRHAGSLIWLSDDEQPSPHMEAVRPT